MDGVKKGKLFPAYAGVIPCSKQMADYAATFPRIRGGDPVRVYLPKRL